MELVLGLRSGPHRSEQCRDARQAGREGGHILRHHTHAAQHLLRREALVRVRVRVRVRGRGRVKLKVRAALPPP